MNPLIFSKKTNIVPGALQANAGTDQTVSRFSPYTTLDSSASTGSIISRTWERLNTNVGYSGEPMIPDGVTTPIIFLGYTSNSGTPYAPGEYHYRLTVSDGVTTSTDTVKVTVLWDTFAPQRNSNGGWRYLTAADYMTVENGAPGDYYIDGANDGFFIDGKFTDIYLAPGTVILGPGKKLLIRGGKYGQVSLNFANGAIMGDPVFPVIITNTGGQVESQRGISIKNVKFCKITGKYVPGITGNIGFQGHGGGQYAFRRGTYGFFANNCWANAGTPGMEISGREASFSTLEHCEAGNGGFAGVYIKSDAVDRLDYYNITVKENYIHDSGGEGVYCGTTATTNPQQLYNFEFYDNVIARASNEGIQIGQQAGGSRVHNNVVFMSATRWISPFNDTQCFGAQWGVTNGDNKFYDNVVIGAGEQLPSIIINYVPGIVVSTDPILMNNNVFYGGKGFIGGFIGQFNGVPGGSITYSNNYHGYFNFQQDKVYQVPYSHAINTPQVMRAQHTMPLTFLNNVRDNTKTQDLSATTPYFTISGTVVMPVLPDFTFNAGFDKTYYTNYSLWAYKIYDSYGDEYGTYSYTKQGQPFTYNIGDMVMWMGKFYVSNINGNVGHMPSGATDAYWTKLTWTNGVTTYDYPPDDFRESITAYYRSKGIGLTATL